MGGDYLAFLLRLQRGQGQTQWRATIQNAQTGEVIYFASERDLIRYLMRVLTITPIGTDSQEAVTHNPDPGDHRDV
jgi:hypothetical protein